MKVIAIDWSGAKKGAEKKIWLAEADERGLLRLECGRSREEVASHLIDLASSEKDLVIGFDFGFSTPSWFLRERGLASAPQLWALAAADAETWLASMAPPFWGGGRGGRPELPEHHRKSDLLLPRVGSVAIKSVFQVGGSGSVGTGSLRGWPVLHRLRQAGFGFWPFGPAHFPLVVEIYPRLLTGAVVKSRRDARVEYLAANCRGITGHLLEAAASCEDAFDAAVSALAMSRHASEFAQLPEIRDSELVMEGIIWYPGSISLLIDNT